MKGVVLFALLAFGPGLTAQEELDSENTATPDQITRANDLPQTTVVRVNNKDNSIEVAYVKDHLEPGKVPDNLVWEKVTEGVEVTGVAFASSNELDVTSSTDSFRMSVRRVSFARGPYGDRTRFTRRVYHGYRGYGYRRYSYPGYRYAPVYRAARYRAYRNYGYPYYGPRGGYARNGYAYAAVSGGGGDCCCCSSNTYVQQPVAYVVPTYVYAGYQYSYQPYYRYSDVNYNYSFCDW